ncbi:MAG TPA: NAD(P)H-binding protein [Sphingobacteriaceae bacterium]
MNSRKAIVIGATGLTGSHLVTRLLEDPRFALVKVFVRKSTGISHPKLQEYVINFDQYQEWKYLVTGDVLFSALGTTLKSAGSKDAQYKVDHTYQYHFARAAHENQVPVLVLVSSASANPASPFFYMRMKGELERDVKNFEFNHIHLLHPGLLFGERKEKRLGEAVAFVILRLLNRIGLLENMRPTHASRLAAAMINISFNATHKVQVYSVNDIYRFAG